MANANFLTHFNGTNGQKTYTAESGQVMTFSPTGSNLDTSKKEFGTTSLALDGAGYVTAPDSTDWQFGSGDFTIDFWAYEDEANGARYQKVFLNYGGATSNWGVNNGIIWIVHILGGALFFQYLDTTLALITVSQFVPNIYFGWHHYAVVYESGIVTIYVDGQPLVSKKIISSVGTVTGVKTLKIGNTINPMKGWMDEIRIVKGTALFTMNFVPPTSEYTLTVPLSPVSVNYDLFSDGVIDTSKWSVFGNVTETANHLVVKGNGAWNTTGVISKSFWMKNKTKVTCKYMIPSSGGYHNMIVGMTPSKVALNFTSGYYFDMCNLGTYTLYNGSISTNLKTTAFDTVYTLTFELGPTLVLRISGGGLDNIFVSSTNIPDGNYYLAFQVYEGVNYIFDDVVYMTTAIPVSTWSVSTLADGSMATSTINPSAVLQLMGSDPYFRTTSDIARVDVYYTHIDGRQQKTITHHPPSFSNSTSWSSFAHDGAWQKTMLKVYTADGAVAIIPRNSIVNEDLSHSNHEMTLNM